MPITRVPSSGQAGPFNSLHAAFNAAGINDPHADISFKDGCIRMRFFHRLNYKAALKRQQDMDAFEVLVGPRLPEAYWKDGRQWFNVGEVDAYAAASQSE